MRKIISGLALFMGLVFMEALAFTQDDVKKLSEECNRGDAPLCYKLGIVYYNGNGVPQDHKKALKLFTQACDEGYADACTNQRILESKLQ